VEEKNWGREGTGAQERGGRREKGGCREKKKKIIIMQLTSEKLWWEMVLKC
jgi:hypothetical protein